MSSELAFTGIAAIASLIGAIWAIVTTVWEGRDAKRFQQEMTADFTESHILATKLQQLWNAHATQHALWEQKLKESQEKSLAAQAESLEWLKQLVEWNTLLAERTPDEWRAWALRVSGGELS